jgi:hypothetical protein
MVTKHSGKAEGGGGGGGGVWGAVDVPTTFSAGKFVFF